MKRGCWVLAFSGLLIMMVAGCSRTSTTASAATESEAGVQRHPMRGTIVGESESAGQITVRQEVIRDFMPAMDAVYTLGDRQALRTLQPGDQISAIILAPPDGGDNRLTNILVTAQPRHPLTESELPPHELLIGEAVPDIPMVNQAGKPVNIPQLHGKAVLLTFVDSKCTEDCPIISARFQKVNMLLEQDGQAFAASHLLTVSIDPANDTPPVLRKYGLKYLDGNAKGFGHWSFVDLTPANLKNLAKDFGVIYRPSGDGDIVHTMLTALIAPDGTVRQVWDGDDWNPQSVAQTVESSAKQSRGQS
ncbi:MAG: SCO family protein [Acidobacteriaceae bacterium]